MIFQTWPLWLQIVAAPPIICTLCAALLVSGSVLCRIVDTLLFGERSRELLSNPLQLPTPTRLRIATEIHPHGHYCPSCGFPTRKIIVVRLWDDTARVCAACASELAPEVAA